MGLGFGTSLGVLLIFFVGIYRDASIAGDFLIGLARHFLFGLVKDRLTRNMINLTIGDYLQTKRASSLSQFLIRASILQMLEQALVLAIPSALFTLLTVFDGHFSSRHQLIQIHLCLSHFKYRSFFRVHLPAVTPRTPKALLH